MATDIH